MISPSIAISPKAQYSCQNSFIPGSIIPGSEKSSASFVLNGNGECVNSPHRFKSLIASAGSSTRMKVVAQQCRMRLFEGDDCAGDAITLDLSDVKDNTCTFHGGKSVKLECGHAALNHVALAPLESLCAKATVPRPSTGSFNYTATASGTTAPKATHHPSGPSISPSPGLASNEYDLHPSLAALVAVIAAALAML
ncbi:hypothetical protein LTR37_019445 [Vermiconidia calcicola]|uniref:Uncharacterized protein n=1 Tax=Vermiconidia calcicola TaxID=1690605 RepID=A0ACC3ME28_9PEZI|nr:hypothetical protein LTR37_019445 [Vermiconidia calcicola]